LKQLFHSIIAITLLLFSGYSASTEAKKEAPWYNIEMIIFAQSLGSSATSEIWPSNPGMPDTAAAIDMDTLVLATSDAPTKTVAIPKNEHILTSEFRQISKRSNALQPLVHAAWRQPVTSKKSTIPLSVSTITDTLHLTGTIKVSVQRYLHVNLDLLLSDQNLTLMLPDELSSQPSYTRTPGQYRFIAHRKMRSEELHYIDHPKLGVIVKATKFKFPEPVLEATITEEPVEKPAKPEPPAPN